jgi:lipopolysaccharide assembly protein A
MLRLILLTPFLIVLVAFSLSNPQPVPLHLWPLDFEITAPLSVAVLAVSGVFFLLGALIVWFGQLAARARARRAERRVRDLESQIAVLERRQQTIVTPPPAAVPAGTGNRLLAS